MDLKQASDPEIFAQAEAVEGACNLTEEDAQWIRTHLSISVQDLLERARILSNFERQKREEQPMIQACENGVAQSIQELRDIWLQVLSTNESECQKKDKERADHFRYSYSDTIKIPGCERRYRTYDAVGRVIWTDVLSKTDQAMDEVEKPLQTVLDFIYTSCNDVLRREEIRRSAQTIRDVFPGCTEDAYAVREWLRQQDLKILNKLKKDELPECAAEDGAKIDELHRRIGISCLADKTNVYVSSDIIRNLLVGSEQHRLDAVKAYCDMPPQDRSRLEIYLKQGRRNSRRR